MQLPNNCSIGKIGVTPKNWETKDAPINEDWIISYRFRDHTLNRETQKKKRVPRNCITQKERRDFVRGFMDNLKKELSTGVNLITGDGANKNIVTIKEALQSSFEKIIVVPNYRLIIKSMLKYVFISLDRLAYDKLPIQEITRGHIRAIFEDLPKHKRIFTPYTHNAYRKDLHKLFAQVVDDELLENNPVTSLKKQKSTKKKRRIITKEERRKILECEKIPYEFRRYIIMFFHSGARSTELLEVKKENVFLNEQYFELTIKKGKEPKEVARTIKTIALPLWEELLKQAEKGQYVFSEGLRPGNVPISAAQITRRWKLHVKDKLGIEADFYTLKHANADEVAEIFEIETAQKLMGHTSEVVTADFYAYGEKKRQHERLKRINNKF